MILSIIFCQKRSCKRNKARRRLKLGIVKKGDNKHIHHIDGNPQNIPSNLRGNSII